MKSIDKLRKRMGVSPVIATVILVAVAITVSVAVAYWMSGIAGQYTSFEKVEIQSATVTYVPATTDAAHWAIVVNLKNTGTKAATLISIFINDVEAVYAIDPPLLACTDGITAELDITTAGEPLQIVSGDSDIVTIWIMSGDKLSSGTTVNVKIHSAGGMDYPKLVQLT